mgnify:CR=1 FL=1
MGSGGLYTQLVQRALLLLSVLTLVAGTGPGGWGTAAAADTNVVTADGDLVAWSEWVRENAPFVLVLWASWAPGASAARDEFAGIADTARTRGMTAVVVSVQESIGEAEDGLVGVEIPWFHDRYGNLLKEYRVVSIPAMVVIDDGGRVVGRIEPTAEALRSWKGE